MLFVLISCSLFVLALLIGHWSVMFLPAGVWTPWALGIRFGWWYQPPGEAYVRGTIALILIGSIAVLLGLLVRWLLWNILRA